MSKFGEELIESLQQAAAHAGGRKISGRARDHGGDSRREGYPESVTHVATPFRRIVSDSASNTEKLGAGEACARCTRGGLLAGDSTPTEGSHGSRRRLSARFMHKKIASMKKKLPAFKTDEEAVRPKQREPFQSHVVDPGRIRLPSIDNIAENLAVAEGEAFK